MHLPCGCIVQRWSWLVERHSQCHIVASRTAHAEPFSQHKRYGGISIVAHLWPAWQPPYRLMTGAFGACPVEQQANVSRATRGHPKRAIDVATLSLRLFLYYFSNIGHAGLLQRTGCGESVDQRRMRGSARLLDSSSHDTDAGRLPSTCRNASSSSIHTPTHPHTHVLLQGCGRFCSEFRIVERERAVHATRCRHGKRWPECCRCRIHQAEASAPDSHPRASTGLVLARPAIVGWI